MKFTLAQVHAAHAKLKSGADFPRYVQELKDLGIAGYTIDAQGNDVLAEEIPAIK